MFKRKLWLSLAAFWVSATVLVMSSGLAAAAGNGLRVSPVRTDLTISPGQTQVVTINLTNVTAGPATFQAIVNDFTGNPNESGDPALILNPNQYASSHSLKRFIQPIPNITLAAGQEAPVSVRIAVPATAAGGGYYGAVRFAPASATGSNQTVSLSGSVGSLILIRVPGNIKEQVSIAGFDASDSSGNQSSFFTSNKNISAIVRFQNEGNIQEEPFGKILLKNNSNKAVGEYEVNNTNPAGNVLPGSIRKFTVPITGVGSFGIYKLDGNFGYGNSGQLLSASTTIYVVPVAAIIGFIVIVLILVFLIFVLPKLIKGYNQRVIRQASRRR